VLEESYNLRTRRNIKQVSILSPLEEPAFNKNFISTPDDFPEFINSDEDWILLKTI
jgi:hypothetical protein